MRSIEGLLCAGYPTAYRICHLQTTWLVTTTEKAMAPHCSTLAWKIPWMEEPDGLQSMGSRRVRYDWATSLSLFTFMHWRRKWQPTPVFLPGESQGWGSLVGCHLCMGLHRVGHDWSDLAAAAAAAMTTITYIPTITTTTKPQKLQSLNWGAGLRILRCSPRRPWRPNAGRQTWGWKQRPLQKRKLAGNCLRGSFFWDFSVLSWPSLATLSPRRPTLPTTHQE